MMSYAEVIALVNSLRPMWEDSCDGTRVLNQVAEHVYKAQEDAPKPAPTMTTVTSRYLAPEPSPAEIATRLLESGVIDRTRRNRLEQAAEDAVRLIALCRKAEEAEKAT